MNKVYKLKFNRNLQQLVVVAEIATNATAGTAAQDVSAITADADLSQAETHEPLRLYDSLLKTGFLVASGLSLAATGVLQAQAMTGAQIVAGQALIEQQGSVTTIKNTPNTIINWQSFNIAKGDLVQFIQESTNSAVLNRVLGSEVSSILGTLKSNGQVFLINPNGVVFGKSAVVDTQSLVASTLNLSNEDFLKGNYVFNQEKDAAIASVLNQGLLKVNRDGSLALVGGNVVNTGILEARQGTVYLLAGQSIQVADFNNPLISYKVTAGNKAVNLGEIIGGNVRMLGNVVSSGLYSGDVQEFAQYADTQLQSRIAATGEVELFAGSVSDTLQTTAQTATQVTGERTGTVHLGHTTIDVSNATGTAGKVKILGDKVQLHNGTTIDASGDTGGYVNIGGDLEGKGEIKKALTTDVASDVFVSVAGNTGKGGTAIVWGDTAQVDGSFKITSEHNDGGFLETSGHTIDIGDEFKLVNPPQALGNSSGTWLLDPDRLYVTEGKTTGLYKGGSGVEDNNSSISGEDATFGSLGKGCVSVVYSGKVLDNLKNYNVVLKADNMVVLDNVTMDYRGCHSLTLKSDVAYIYKSCITLSHLALDLRARSVTITNGERTNRNQFGQNLDSLTIVNSKVDIVGLNPSISVSGGLCITDNSQVNWLAFGVNYVEQNFDFKRLTIHNSNFTVGSTLRIPKSAYNGGVNLYGAYKIKITNSNFTVDGQQLKDWNFQTPDQGWQVLTLAILGDFAFSEGIQGRIDMDVVNSNITTSGNFSIQPANYRDTLNTYSTGNLNIYKSNISTSDNAWLKFGNVNITQSNITTQRGFGCFTATDKLIVDKSNLTFRGTDQDISEEHILTGKTINITNSWVSVPSTVRNLYLGSKDSTVASTVLVSGSNITAQTGLWVDTQGGTLNFTNSNISVPNVSQTITLKTGTGKAEFNHSRVLGEGNLNFDIGDMQVNRTNITSTSKTLTANVSNLNITNSNISGDTIKLNLSTGGSEYKITDSNLTASVHDLLICSSNFKATDKLEISNSNLTGQPTNISLVNGALNLTKVAASGKGFIIEQTDGGELLIDKSKVEVGEEIDISRGGTDDKSYVFKDSNLKGRGVSVYGAGANTDKAQALLTNSTIEAEAVATFAGTKTLVNTSSKVQGKSGVNILGTNLKLAEKVQLLSSDGYVNLGNTSTSSVETYDVTLIAGDETKKTNVANAHDVTMCGTKVVVNNTKVHALRDVNISAGTDGLFLQNSSKIFAERSYNITGGTINLDKTNLVSVNANYSGHLEATNSDFTVAGTEFQAQDKITVKASGNLIVDKNATISSKNSYVESVKGKVELQEGSSVTATEGEVGITAFQGSVVIDKATVTAKKQASVKANGGTVQIKNGATVTSETGEAYVKGAQDVTITGQGSKVTGNEVNITSDQQVILTDKAEAVTNLQYDPTKPHLSGKVNLEGTTGVIINQSSKAAAGSVTLTSSAGKVTIANANATATGQGLTITGTKGVTFDNATATSKLGMTVAANDGDILLTNSSTVTSKDVSVSISGKSITSKVNSTVSGSSTVALVATDKVDLTNITVTSKRNEAKIAGANGVTLNNVTLTGYNTSKVESTAGLITLKNNTLVNVSCATAGDASVIGASVDMQEGTAVLGKSAVTVQATGTTANTGTVKVNKAVICATLDAGTATVEATKDITLTASCVTAKAGVTVNSSGGKTTVSGGLVNAENGLASVAGNKGVELNTDAQVTGKNASVTSADGKVLFKDGSDLIATDATAGTATVTGKEVELQANSEVKGDTATVSSTGGTLEINNAKVTGTKEATVSSTGGLATLKDGATVEAQKATVTSTDNSVLLQGSTVHATAGEAKVSAATDVTVEAQSKVYSDTGAATIDATNGNAQLINSELTAASTAKATLKAGLEAKASSATISGKDVDVIGGTVTLEQSSTVKPSGALLVCSTTGGITINTGAQLGGDTVTTNSKTTTEIKDASLVANKQVSLTAGTDLTLDNAPITSNTSNIEAISTAGNIDVKNGSKLTADQGSITLTASAGDVKTSASSLDGKSASISGATAHLGAGTHINATDGITLSTTNDAELNGVSLKNTAKGNIKLESTQSKLTLEDSVVTSQNALEVRGVDIDVIGTNATTTTNEISIGDAATTGQVTVRNANFTTGGGAKDPNLTAPLDINFRGGKGVSVVGSSIDAARDANFSSPSGTVHLGSSCVSQARSVNITAENLWLDDMELKSDQDIDLSFNGWVQVTNGSKVESEKTVTISGNRYVNITNTLVNGTTTTLKSADGFVNTDHAELIATTGTLKAEAKTNALFNHTSLTGPKVELTVTDNDLRITGCSTLVTPENIVLKADKGTVEVAASRVETTGDATTIDISGKNVVLNNGTNVSAKSDITITATEDLKAQGTNITTSAGDVKLTASCDIVLNNTNVSGKAITATATGDLTTISSQVTAENEVKLEATDATATASVNNTTVTSKTSTVTVSGKGAANLGNGTILQAPQKVSVTSDGKVTTVGTNLTSTAADVEIQAKGDVSLTNTNVSGKTATTVTSEAKVTTDHTLITAEGGDAKVVGTTVTLGKTAITSPTMVNVTSTAGKVTVTDGTLTAGNDIDTTKGKVVVSGTDDVVFTNGSVVANTDVSIKSNTNVKLNNLTATATNGKLEATAQRDLVLGNGTKLTGKEEVSLTATEGNLSATGSNITSTNDVKLKAHQNLTLTNTNVSGKNVTLTSETANASLGGTDKSLISVQEDLTVKGQNVILGKGLDATVQGNVNLEASRVPGKEGSVIGTGGSLSAEQGLSVTAGKDIDLINTSLAGKTSIKLETDKGDITLNNSTVGSEQGKADVTSAGKVNLGNGTNISGTTVSVESKGGELTAVGSNITSSGEVTLKASTSVSLTNTNVSGTQVDVFAPTSVTTEKAQIHATTKLNITSTNEVTLTNSSVAGDASVVIASTEKSVTLNNSTATSKDGTLDVVAKENINLGNGTKLEAQGDITVDAGQKITAVGSNITSTTGDVQLQAKQEISLTNTNVSGKDVVVNSSEASVSITGGSVAASNSTVVTAATDITLQNATLAGDALVSLDAQNDVNINNSSVTSSNGELKVHAGNNINLGNGTKLQAEQDVTLDAEQKITSVGSNITSNSGTVDLTAKEDISLTNTNISGNKVAVDAGKEVVLDNTTIHGKDVVTVTAGANVTAQDSTIAGDNKVNVTATGNLVVHNSTVESAAGSVDLNAGHDVVLGNGINVSAKVDVNIHAESNITATGTNITTDTGTASLHSKANITLTNTNISGNKVAVDAGKEVVLDNSTIHGKDVVTVTAGANVTAQDSTIAGDNKVNVTASGNLVVNNSTVESSAGSVDLNAGHDVILGNGTNVSGKENVNINAEGNISATGTNITTDTGSANLHAKANITLTNTNISGNKVAVDAGKEVVLDNSTIHGKDVVTVTAGANVTAQDSTIAGDNKVNVTASGNLVVNNSTVESSAGSVDLNAGHDVILGNGTNVSGKENVNINAEGNISATGTNITAENGSANLHAKANITLTNTNISGNKVNVDAGSDVVLDNSTIHGKDVVTVTAGGNVTAQDSTIAGDNKVNVTASGNLVVNNSTVESSAGSVDLNAGKDVILGNGTNVSGKENVNINAVGNITATGTNITAENGSANLHAKENITLTNTNISGNHVVVGAGQEVTLDNATISGKDTTTITAGGNVTAQDSNVSGGNNVNISADGNVVINNSTVESTAGSVDINAGKDVMLGNGTNVTGQGNVNVNAQGNITAEGTNITSNQGDVNLVAKENITLNNTNISGKDINVNAGNNVTVTDTIMNSTHNTNITAGGHVEINNMTSNSGHNTTIVGNTVNITGSDLRGENIDLEAEQDLNAYNNTFIVDDQLSFTTNKGKLDLEGNYGEGITLVLSGPHSGAIRDVNNEWHFKRRQVKLQRNDDVLLPPSPEGLLDHTTDEIVRDYGRDYDLWDTLGFAFGDEGDGSPVAEDRATDGEASVQPATQRGAVQLASSELYKRIFATCSVQAQALLTKHNITPTDLLEMSLAALQAKYRLSKEEVEVLQQGCVAEHREWWTRSLLAYLQAQAKSNTDLTLN